MQAMASVCRFAFSPGACVASQYSLSSLGLGHTAGLTCRPQLLCKVFVHECLFEIAVANACQTVKLRQYTPRLWILPDPLWTDNFSKHRLVGKQAVVNNSSLDEVSKRRNVKSHRQATVSVSWTEEESACIGQAANWRDRHRLEKSCYAIVAPVKADCTCWRLLNKVILFDAACVCEKMSVWASSLLNLALASMILVKAPVPKTHRGISQF